MIFELSYLFGMAVAYLLLLFLIAYAAERGWIPPRIARHPVTYVLSLGVYATSWSYYGSVGFAQIQGYNFLTIYLGVTLAFLLTPVLLMPILRLTREYQLTSLADLFAFRYRSQLIGVLITVFMLIGTLPYISLQIRAVTESIRVLTQAATPAILGLGFCVMLILFAILFGARHTSSRERHEGLVVAIAFESAVKLVALSCVGAFAVFGLFSGPTGLNEWLVRHPEALQALYRPVREGPWTTLILLSFAAAFLLPRQFHMTFTENIDRRTLPVASWAFPLFLLLVNLPILPILWAGMQYQPTSNPDYYVLGITLVEPSIWLPTVAFVGGVSAASAMMIVSTLALAAMCLNHLLLPASYPDPTVDLYRWLLWGRRVIIALIILLGYGFYLILERNQGLVQLGLISFVAVAQFLPGIVGVLFWPRATRWGVVAGLGAGAVVWAVTLLLPLLQHAGMIGSGMNVETWTEASGQDRWSFVTFWSLALNSLLFVIVSLVTRQSPDEVETAHACCRETGVPLSGVVNAASPRQFEVHLARLIGHAAAAREVRQALYDLGMSTHEARPAELRRLRERIELNLSGLMGPPLARMIVNDQLRMDPTAQLALGDSVRFLEDRLEKSRTRLRGLAGELDALRRYHREIFRALPIGVCALGPDREIVIWNEAMNRLSGIDGAEAVGTPAAALPEPWAGLFGAFSRTTVHRHYKQEIVINGRTRWFNLYKARVPPPTLRPGPQATDGEGMVILVEELTELQTLEQELAHSERLASIGRLAAGVAHEIGNPVTGIACLAQNLGYEEGPSGVRDTARQILEQTRRISDIVQSLVTFSHSGSAREAISSSVALWMCVEDAVRLVHLSHSGKQVECANRIPRKLEVLGDRQRLQQVFVNLLSNACDASCPGDIVEVIAKTKRHTVEIQVKDQGCGIPDELRERIFEPFFTTKEPGEGTGLGLPLVYSIVRDHGGTVTVDSAPGRGTRVTLRLPLKRGETDSDRPSSEAVGT